MGQAIIACLSVSVVFGSSDTAAILASIQLSKIFRRHAL
jgi:hypothetical protein